MLVHSDIIKVSCRVVWFHLAIMHYCCSCSFSVSKFQELQLLSWPQWLLPATTTSSESWRKAGEKGCGYLLINHHVHHLPVCVLTYSRMYIYLVCSYAFWNLKWYIYLLNSIFFFRAPACYIGSLFWFSFNEKLG